ncbi:MAG: DUF2723 domain-containing protein [Verrucomicrobia bacterium]|nr:DUF2723 domain-containing protein [Verrucomicrobiota bacterium]
MSQKSSKAPVTGKPASPSTSEADLKPQSPSVLPPGQSPPQEGQPAGSNLFRKVDWLAFVITFAVTMAVYLWTLAPDLTLEDSGELAVASMYAGVPHPPGYPVWTVYTWLFTLLPIGGMAYRVGLSSAFAAALSCGLIGMMVSRGGSMLLEGIALFKGLGRKLEDQFCLVSGIVAGALIGFNGFMWSQATIVEVYTLSVLSLAGVLICFMKWAHQPSRLRYLYLAFFWFGICFNNHQSLLVIAMALEIGVIAVAPRLGREFLFWNVVVFAAGLVLAKMGFITSLNENGAVMAIYCLVGIASVLGWMWLLYVTAKPVIEVVRDVCIVVAFGCLALIAGSITNHIETFDNNRSPLFLIWLGLLGSISAFIVLTWFPHLLGTERLGPEWRRALTAGVAWAAGSACYLYMPLAGMSNPPLNWGYPRTVTGFIHAFTRGQYERIHPTTDSAQFLKQIDYTLIDGTLAEFSLICVVFGLILAIWWVSRQDWSPGLRRNVTLGYTLGVVVLLTLLSEPVSTSFQQNRIGALWMLMVAVLYIGLLPLFGLLLNPAFVFWKEMQKREKAWIIMLTAVYAMLGPFLLILLNPAPDRQSQDLNKVFFTASHVLVAMGVGYGVLLVLSVMSIAYESIRKPFIIGMGLVTVAAMVEAAFVFDTSHYGLHHFTAIYGLSLAAGAAALVFLNKTVAPLGPLMAIFLLAPGHSALQHWENNEQRGHLFGYWFGHDMFTPPYKGKDGKPLYPEMDKHTILFGGTDPGRFNPTYMIFCESFTPARFKPNDPDFDRRDVYLITQNALADGTYLQYIRAHYNRSAQIDPPFFTELLRGPNELGSNYETNWIARLAVPVDRFFLKLGDQIEKNRRAGSSFFEPDHFTDAASLAAKLKAQADLLSAHVWKSLSTEAQAALGNNPGEGGTLRLLARDLNQLLEQGPLLDAARFQHVTLSQHVKWFVEENPQSHTRIRLNRLLLEEAYPKEIAKSPGGVYPDREIKTPSNDDNARCFNEYIGDANRRLEHDMRNPAGPKLIKPGEDVKVVGGRVQVSGQVAVMSINGLLTKTIFDANPNHEFYVEESFPLDWMYPHLTPYGIIMKINRNPVGPLTQEVLDRDREFWSQYSERLIGNWIKPDTSIKEICDWAERIYLHRDYRGFTGDRRFVRDSDGQKAFSKLRSSIGGLYAWRVQNTRDPAEQQRVLREAEFALKQSFAYCPYSPEAVFRYINILVSLSRFDEALQLSRTSLKFDPVNGQLRGLIGELENIKRNSANAAAAGATPVPADPSALALQGIMQETSRLLASQQTNQAMALVDSLMTGPTTNDVNSMIYAAQIYNNTYQISKAEQALRRYATLMGDQPEAWFDLAAMQAMQNKAQDALESLKTCLNHEARRKAAGQTSAYNLKSMAQTDQRFAPVRANPAFQELLNSIP